MLTSITQIQHKYPSFLALIAILTLVLLFSPQSSFRSLNSIAKRALRSKEQKNGPSGITISNQEANESELQRELHQHREEESEDWWEVQRTYEYQTADSWGDFFLVQVEEAQVIHKQHAELDDVKRGDLIKSQNATSNVLNTNTGFVKGSTEANSTDIEAEETQLHQREDMLEVKQYQKIHVVQANLYGLVKNEYEEERLTAYEYSLSIDEFNQWEMSSDVENQSADNLVLGYQRRNIL